MTICKFFATPKGCSRGDQCRFQHVLPGTERLVDGIKSPAIPVEECWFFKQGHCKNGSSCRFRHDTIGHKSTEDTEQELAVPDEDKGPVRTSQPSNANARELGGALVKFGPGGVVTSIAPVSTSTARLQMCNVSCTWYRPSKTATLEFTRPEMMMEAAKRLKGAQVLSRKLQCSEVVNKKTRPWVCIVKVGNLDPSTTQKMLRGVCSDKQPKNIVFGDDSYSSSNEEISLAIQRLLLSVGPVESWILPANIRGSQIKASATFSSTEQAKQAVTELNEYKLPLLGGSKIFLSHMVKAKFSILTAMHAAVSPELAKVQQSLSSEGYLEIKAYSPTAKASRFTTLHVISNTAQRVGKAKAAVESILRGHTAKGAKETVWNEFFLKPEGMAFLTQLGKEHDVFIYRNARKRVLSLYGAEEEKAVVESVLIKTVEDLATATSHIDLDDGMPSNAVVASFRKVVERLGKAFARLSTAAGRQTITVHGTQEETEWARNVLSKSYDGDADDHRLEVDAVCAVCWCDVGEAYKTPCGHVYDQECFRNQCLSAEDNDVPIKCLGSSGKCQDVIPFTELEAQLGRDQLTKFLENSFASHIRTRPERYQFCPTADCDQVYEVTDCEKIFTCASCLTSVCTKCKAVCHEGLTCEQYKRSVLDDGAFAGWKKLNDARDCPKCGCTIQKSEGCNHMECRACRTHICWVCMKTFERGEETYVHMRAEHGGCYDEDYGL